jgi:hypothetical protein
MAIYAVYSPKGVTPVDAPEKLRFVPERPSLWAFVVPPVWLLARRLWLGFALWLVAVVALSLATRGMVDDPAGLIWLAFWLWFAFAARDIEQASLTRAGWRLIDLVEAPTVSAAERRHFDRAYADRIGAEAPVGPAPVRRPAAGVIGFEAFGGAPR